MKKRKESLAGKTADQVEREKKEQEKKEEAMLSMEVEVSPVNLPGDPESPEMIPVFQS